MRKNEKSDDYEPEMLYDDFLEKHEGEYIFEKDENHPDNIVWEVFHIGYRGELLFSFDKKIIYNLWTDYPYKFSPEEKEIFDREYPYWADFFKDRTSG